jgi:hypothetical protein
MGLNWRTRKMPNKDYTTMIKYGEWLQFILGNDIEWGDLTKRFKEAINFLNLDYKLPAKDLSLLLIRKIEREKARDHYIDLAYRMKEKGDYSRREALRERRDPLNLYDFISDLQDTIYKNRFPDEYFDEVLNSVVLMYRARRTILRWLEELIKDDVLWDFSSETLIKIEDLIKYHNGIRKALDFNEDEGLRKVITLTESYQYDVLGIPTHVILSHIFLEFLLLGGQQHFGFCEHCKGFFAVQRKKKGKQKKQYCRKTCRTNASKLRADQK